MKLKMVCALVLAIAFFAFNSAAQTAGDYQSNVNPTGNWNAVGSWQTYNGSSWVAATNYPGEVAGAGTVTIRDGDNITLSNSPPNAIGALVIGEGASGIFQTNNGDRTLNVTNGLTVKAGASFNLRRMTLSIGTNTQIDGALTDNHDNGSVTFSGTFTVGSTGSVSTANASAFTFTGAITNNGTIDLTGGGTLIIKNGLTNNNSAFDIGDVTFNTNTNQSIAGSATTTFSGIVTVTGITVINNNSDLNLTSTSNNSITGTGTWQQGATGALKFSGGSMNVTTVDFDASGNTVDYTRGGAQTVRSATYHHLTISTSGTKTLGGAITVNGNLDVTTTSTTTLACDVYQITGNASGTFTMASGTTMTLGNTANATNVLFPSNFTNANITLNSASTVTYQNNSTQTVSSTPTYGNLTIATGSTKTLNGNATIGGNLLISAGTFDLGTTATTVNITGTATVTGTLTYNGTTTKTVSITGNLSGGGTINMSGGSLLHVLNLGGATNAITTFTTAAVASTVNYNAAGDQQVFSSANYRSLTISGSGVKTLAGTVTVNNNLSISGSATLASDIYQITGNASGTCTMASGTTLSLGRTSNAANVLFPSNFTNGNISLNTASTVIYQSNAAQTVSNTPTYGGLTIATSNVKTLAGATTVNGNLAITGTATLACSTFQITGNASGTFTMASGTTLTLGNTGNATNVLFPTNFTNGNISLNSASTVTYQNNSTQTVSSTPTYGNLTIATGSTKTLNGNVTIGGNLTISAGTFDLGTTATTVSISGNATVTGTLSFNGTTTKTVSISGDLSGAGTINMSGGSLLHNLNLGGANNAITTFTTAAVASTVTYTRAGDQQVFASVNYRNLSTSGSGTKSMQGAVTVNNTFTIGNGTSFDPVGSNITVSGSSVFAGTLAESNNGGTNSFQDVDLSGGTINGSVTDATNINGNLTMPTGNGTISRTTLTVFGTTTVADGRSLTIGSSTGVKTFRGAVIISGSGSWNSTVETNAADMVFRAGIDVTDASGSFLAGAATFSNNDQNITGAGPISFANAVSINGARVITNTNTAGVTFNNTVTGTAGGSTWKNGTNGVTYYKPAATTQPMNTGTLDVSATGNQFHYSRAGDQNIKVPATSYYHLYISGGSSGIKTVQGATTVDGDLYIAASTSLNPAGQNFTVSGTSTIAGTLADGTLAGTTDLLHVDLSGGTIDGAATGVININGNLTMPSGNGTIGRATLTVTGTTTIATGRSLTFNANSNTGVKRFDGMITLNGTGTWTSTNVSTPGNLDLRGGIDVASASGSFAAGVATFNASQSVTGAGAITFANAVSVAGAITVTNTNTYGVTFNNTIDGTVAGSTWTQGANAIVNYQPGVATRPMNTGVLDASGAGNTFNYSRSGVQTIKVPSTAYHHLSLSTLGGGVTKTIAGATTVNGNLSIGTNVTLDVDAAQNYALVVKGNFSNSGAFQPQTGTVTFSGTSDQAITSNGSSFYTVVLDNSGTEVTLNDNFTISNTLTMNDGIITTGANRVIISSSAAGALVCASSSNFVNGNLRRYLATNTSTYVFPIGNGTSASNSYRAELINNNLAGITYIDSRFKPLAAHDDAEMDVADNWENGALTYTSINTAGVWELEPNAQPSAGSYGIRFYIANMSGLADNEFGLLKRPVGSTSGADWTTGGGRLNPNDIDGRTVASGYAKRIGLTSFSEFGIGSGTGSGVGLPIELLSFSADVEAAIVKLKWVTATEINNDFFTVERSQDGITFEELDVFEGAGNSSETLSYETFDRHPFDGVSYYRLKQTDYDGAFTYSDVVSVSVVVEIENPQPEFTVFPNPVSNGRFFVRAENLASDNTPVYLDIIDASGRIVFSNTLQTEGAEQLTVELPDHIRSGIYFIMLRSGHDISRHTVVVN